MQNPEALPPITEVHTGPTNSAWSQEPLRTAPPQRETPPPQPWLQNVPLLILAIPAVVFVAFAVAILVLMIMQGSHLDKQLQSLVDENDQLRKQIAANKEEIADIKTTQASRKTHVELIPGILTSLQTIQQQLTTLATTLKVVESQGKNNMQDIDRRYQDITALRKDLTVVMAQIQDLKFVRKPRPSRDALP